MNCSLVGAKKIAWKLVPYSLQPSDSHDLAIAGAAATMTNTDKLTVNDYGQEHM